MRNRHQPPRPPRGSDFDVQMVKEDASDPDSADQSDDALIIRRREITVGVVAHRLQRASPEFLPYINLWPVLYGVN